MGTDASITGLQRGINGKREKEGRGGGTLGLWGRTLGRCPSNAVNLRRKRGYTQKKGKRKG
jgi:hypothetical protein